MRRFQALFKIVLLAAVMLTAAGMPAVARPPFKEDVRIVRVEKKKTNFLSAWIKSIRANLTRYAMAAN